MIGGGDRGGRGELHFSARNNLVGNYGLQCLLDDPTHAPRLAGRNPVSWCAYVMIFR
jgi:hypothetical protein